MTYEAAEHEPGKKEDLFLAADGKQLLASLWEGTYFTSMSIPASQCFQIPNPGPLKALVLPFDLSGPNF